ncbi:MAG TPA: methyl-accepting chemotaxis protein [Chloroflexia bacterium]|nr:methyl-accepting chemotaxis protein [Chloroflexia bacterium]
MVEVTPEQRTPRPLELDSRASSLSRLLRPLIDTVAGVNASVRAKLFVGFQVGVILLLGMAALSLIVIDRMGEQVAVLNRLEDKTDRARQMEYAITSQSHFRAMALLTRDNANNDKIAKAKKTFADNLDVVASMSGPAQIELVSKLRADNDRFTDSSSRVLVLDQAGQVDAALKLHLAEEHPISHDLETGIRTLESSAVKEMTQARADFDSGRNLLTGVVVVFSAVSVILALLLGYVLSWSFLQPVRKIGTALTSIAAGDFGRHVDVINRDEFGALSHNLNVTSTQLASLYNTLRDLNREQEEELQQFARLTAAASAVEAGIFAPESLDEVAARTDPLGQLARVLQGMTRQVQAREQQLKRQVADLRIEIDYAKQARQVSEITESDFFTEMQQKVRDLKMRRPAGSEEPQPVG